MMGAKGDGVEIVYYLQNCCSDLNIGNKLSRLYHANIMAMAIGADFLYVCPTHKDTGNRGSIMSRLAQERIDSESDARHVVSKTKSVAEICDVCDSNHPHQCATGEIGLVVPIVIDDLQGTVRHASDYDEGSFDVALHYRCGDILGLHTEKYGILPHSTFVRLIQAKHDREDNISIVVLSNVLNGNKAGKNARSRDVLFAATCQILVDDLVEYLSQSFPNARISIPTNGSIAVDYFRLIRATSMAICGPSTFCLWPTLANPNAKILNSRLFPWIKQLDGSNSTVFDSVMLKPRKNQTILDMGVASILAWLRTS
ncbi:unnamed protein product [Cylindrotheca closterium]|uniref:Uncharacterized protein n=1 Tax=Cylindrotheca closterium TaxID=2856 RepID=A0AAD2FHD6_9STRA|nr:unnamed protein product [Cylindrotheca closterium]